MGLHGSSERGQAVDSQEAPSPHRSGRLGVQQLGHAAVAQQAAGTELKTLIASLELAKAALAKAPNDPKLKAGVEALEKQLPAAKKKAKDADAGYVAEFKKTIKDGSPRAENQRIDAARPLVERELTQAREALGSATKAVEVLEAKAKAVRPVSNKLKAELTAAKATQASARTKVSELEASASSLDARLTKNQITLLGRGDGFDNRVDAASKTEAAQRAKLGAPVKGVSAREALAYDLDAVQKALADNPKNGAETLAAKLKDATAEHAANLVNALAPQIDKMVEAAGRPGNQGSPQALMQILDGLPPALQKTFAQKLVPLAKDAESGILGDLKSRMNRGEGFSSAAALIGAMPKGNARIDLINNTDRAVASVAADYKNAKAKSDETLADFSRATFGFAQSFPTEKVGAYRDQFVASNKATFDKTEAAAAKYLEVAKLAATGAFDALGTADTNTLENGLRQRLRESGENLPALLESESGKQLVQTSLQAQQNKQPNFLDTLSVQATKAAKVVSISTKTADVLAKGMVKFATLRGTDPQLISSMIEKNANALGIPDKVKSAYANAIAIANDPRLPVAERLKVQQTAANEIKGGKYGNAVTAMGLLLTGPAIVNGWYNFKDSSSIAQATTIINTVNAGKDLVSLVSDAAVLGKITRVTGGLAAAVSVIQGIDELRQGKYVDGGTSIAAGVGGALMLVPGGQLVGAAVMLGAAVVRFGWGSDPAADAEDKAEALTKGFLEQMNIRPEIAEQLKDVLQKGLRGVGAAMPQLAEALNVSPADLMTHLNGRDVDRVRAFVKMVKELPSDGQLRFADRPGTPVPGRANQVEIKPPSREDPTYRGPDNIQTAVDWMRRHGFQHVVKDATAREPGQAGFGNNPHPIAIKG